MKTKLFSFAMIFILSASLSMAQSNKAKMSFAVLGGVNFQNLNGKNNNGDKLEYDMILGYHAGVNIQIPIAPEIYFQPGLLYTTKGAKINGTSTTTIKLSYVEVPLNLVYKGSLGKGFVMFGFGPYIGYGLGGKVIYESGSENIEFKKVVKTGDPLTVTYIKPFDAGGNIFAGFEMAGGLFLQVDAQLGMLKINPEYEGFTDNKTAVKNTGFGLSIGYRF